MLLAIQNKDDLAAKLAEAGDRLVVLDFSAPWCGPCRMIGPKVDELGKEFADLLILKVDVDEFEDIAMEYNVSTMPTFIFLRKQHIITSFSGANYEKLRTAIETNIKDVKK